MSAEEQFVRAMKKLLETTPLSRITIQMIEEESGLSRATFYRHFSDKYELMNAYYDHFLNALVLPGQKEPSICEILTNILRFFEENREFFVHLVKYDGQNSFSEYHFKRLYSYMEQRIRCKKGTKPSAAEYTAMDIACAGSGYCLKKWILQGMKPSPEVFARQMVAGMPNILEPYFS